MNELEDIADSLNRSVKIALDTGEASTIEEAERIFAGYRMQIVVGHDVADSAVRQAALFTAINCASRTLLGGVSVIGAGGPLRVSLPGVKDVESAVRSLGAKVSYHADPYIPTLLIGAADLDGEQTAIRATFTDWAGGVVPASASRLLETGECTPAGVLAGALAVSEIFQHLRGSNPMACRRQIGLNLWRPGQDWRKGDAGPALSRLPSALWLIGLGNLGQAYLWTLGLLPYDDQGSLEVVLQDTDVLAKSNLSTSVLTTEGILGRKKTRAIADWAEARGFRTKIVERDFAPDFTVSPKEPRVALVGVDNSLARQGVEDVGFDRVIEAGLGRGPQDFLGITMHTFPASKTAREVWSDIEPEDAHLTQPAYRALLERTGDRCGTVRLAGRSIGAPFVGAVAGSLVVAELLRLTTGAHRHEMVSCHLRDLGTRTVVSGEEWKILNPGSIIVSPSQR